MAISPPKVDHLRGAQADGALRRPFSALREYTPAAMSTAKRLHYDYADYLRSLEMSELKLEYCDGFIYAMAGGSPVHAQLSAATIVVLHRVLPKGCRLATSDMKVRVESTDLSTFPDVTVICGEARAAAIDENAVTNPTLIVEVTSKSTEDYDRGDKLSHYKQIPTTFRTSSRRSDVDARSVA